MRPGSAGAPGAAGNAPPSGIVGRGDELHGGPVLRLRAPRVPHRGGRDAAGGAGRPALRAARHPRRPPPASRADPAHRGPGDRHRIRAHGVRLLARRPVRRAPVPHPGGGAVTAVHPHRACRRARTRDRARRRRARPARALAIPRLPGHRRDHRPRRDPHRLRERSARGGGHPARPTDRHRLHRVLDRRHEQRPEFHRRPSTASPPACPASPRSRSGRPRSSRR